MTRSRVELRIALAGVVLGTVGYLFGYAPAEVLGLLLACVALGMLIFRTLPADDEPSSTSS